MKKLAPAVLILTLAAPLSAQEAEGEGEGYDMMQDGARQMFRGLMDEMGPALEGLRDLTDEMRPKMRDFAENMGPALRDLMTEVEDWSVYHPPEMLDNGDIILRRKSPDEMPDAVPQDPDADIGPGGDIEI